MAKATNKVSATAQGAVPGTQKLRQPGEGDAPSDAGKPDDAPKGAPADVGPALVIFGRDDKAKGHAAWFDAADAELAERAAALMGYQALRVTTEAIRVKALETAPGRIFGSGKALAQFCRMPLLEALEAFPEAFKPTASTASEIETAKDDAGLEPRWQPLQVGTIVLATLGGDQGWFEARVTEDRGESLYVLAWVGWPGDPTIVRHANALALLPTQMQAATASVA